MPSQAGLQAVVIVNTVKNWSDQWLLRLNIDKCIILLKIPYEYSVSYNS